MVKVKLNGIANKKRVGIAATLVQSSKRGHIKKHKYRLPKRMFLVLKAIHDVGAATTDVDIMNFYVMQMLDYLAPEADVKVSYKPTAGKRLGKGKTRKASAKQKLANTKQIANAPCIAPSDQPEAVTGTTPRPAAREARRGVAYLANVEISDDVETNAADRQLVAMLREIGEAEANATAGQQKEGDTKNQCGGLLDLLAEVIPTDETSASTEEAVAMSSTQKEEQDLELLELYEAIVKIEPKQDNNPSNETANSSEEETSAEGEESSITSPEEVAKRSSQTDLSVALFIADMMSAAWYEEQSKRMAKAEMLLTAQKLAADLCGTFVNVGSEQCVDAGQPDTGNNEDQDGQQDAEKNTEDNAEQNNEQGADENGDDNADGNNDNDNDNNNDNDNSGNNDGNQDGNADKNSDDDSDEEKNKKKKSQDEKETKEQLETTADEQQQTEEIQDKEDNIKQQEIAAKEEAKSVDHADKSVATQDMDNMKKEQKTTDALANKAPSEKKETAAAHVDDSFSDIEVYSAVEEESESNDALLHSTDAFIGQQSPESSTDIDKKKEKKKKPAISDSSDIE